MRRPEHLVLAAAAAVTVAGALTDRPALQRAAKPLIGPSLAVRVLRARADLSGTDTALLLAGLAAATVGDVYMLEPDDDARIVQGASAFAAMHGAYSRVLRRHGARSHLATALPRLAASGGLGALLARRAPEVAAPLGAYGLTLSATSTLAADPALAPAAPRLLGLPLPSRSDPRTWLAAGGLTFAASDALVAVRRTVIANGAGRSAAEGVVLASYVLAQLLLVEGMLELARRK
ncbi:lysoplasmalogenase [Rhodococcus sp. X156]|uniref:lysoplasmalogenase n=1 Tax=Rhodococcus sp. X156 TaxID=2499145 RepID=UPI000FD9C0F1|nr:lysoplasmalogenase [Rhodococcus sp. X156]